MTTTTTTTSAQTSGGTVVTTVTTEVVGTETTTTTVETTYYDFTPSDSLVFSFSPTFDDATYTVTVPWNVAGQRYYVTVTDQSGNRIYTLPLIGSPSGYDISLNAGYFDTTMVYRIQNKQIEVTTTTVTTSSSS